MSKYTVTIYELIRNNFDFGLQDYEIFNEEYREILNSAILDFYKFKEIGYQNPYKFKDRLNERMNRIMREKYNALYKAKSIEFNPLYNIEIKETFEHSVENENNDTTNTNNITTSSAFPMSEMLESEIPNDVYIDNATRNNAKDTTTSNGTTTESYTRMTEGSSAGLPFSKAMIQLKQYYDKYNLDSQVIEELSDLFMNVW